MYFDYFGSVDFLTSIVAGSLKQKNVLNQSVRCWAILTSLYGSGELLSCKLGDREQFSPDEDRGWFSISDWMNNVTFVNSQDSHTSLSLEEFKQVTIERWLFGNSNDKTEWFEAFKDKYLVNDNKITNLLSSSKNPFEVDPRTLSNDFNRLFDKGWLRREKIGKVEQKRRNKKTQEIVTICKPVYKYTLVEDWQDLIPNSVKQSQKPHNSSQDTFACDIHKFFDNFARPINGKQRFFIDVEYIVPSKESDKIEALQKQLKQIWSQTPIPPLKLTYRSAKLFQDIVDFTVYPVCFYYVLRAPYLFAYGQFPQGDEKIGWYDFRIDRIENIETLDWNVDREIPLKLREQYQNNSLPQPELVKNSIGEAVGYDFYKSQEMMYLRFDRYFHANYIEGTERDILYRKVSAERVKFAIAKSDIERKTKDKLIQKLGKYSQDIYCEVPYYLDDNNVVMRLRAWGAKVEVILPKKLRQRMIEDLKDTEIAYQ